MPERDSSDLEKAQLLDILTELHGLIEGRRVPVPPLATQSPSKLESAVSRQLRAPAARIAPHPQLLAAIVEASFDAISSRTLDGVLLTWNRGAERIYGFSAQELIGRRHDDLVPNAYRQELADINRRLAQGESIQDFETVRRRKDGSLIQVSINLAPIFEHGKVVRVCTIARDITTRKATETALQEALLREQSRASELAAVLDAVPAAVFIAHDRECRRVTGNRAASELLDVPAGSNMSRNAQDRAAPRFRIFRNGRELGTEDLPVEKAARHGVEVRGFEEDLVFEDGNITHLIGNAKPLHDGQGKLYGAVAAFIDISERKEAEEHIRRMAHLDPLTSLPNRTLLMDRLQQALSISQRNQTRTGVLFLDLDRFKEINDRLGHHVGDQLLQEVAARLRAAIREADTVSRLGGDEFIVVLPELHEAADAAGVARKILNAISAEYVIAGQRLFITPSLGISVFPDHAEEAGTLLRLADKAMYEAKQSGRNTYRFYEPGAGFHTPK
jgi:diguanylate cyclase (GGDEF)-like protein/PAS domain S-box-containing protein